MSHTAQKMDDRIQLRANNEEKALLKLASQVAGFRNLTTYIMNTMINESRKVLREQGKRVLSEKDSEIVLNSLINPPIPNENLRRFLKSK
jgi:uncharacterized protein (DUF1778 family)